MKKKVFLVFLVTFMVLGLSVTTTTGVLDLIDKVIPQPVYSVMDGLEKLKYFNELENLSISNDALFEEYKQTQWQIDQAQLFSILLGNRRVLERIVARAEGLDNMSLWDVLNMSFEDIIELGFDLSGNILVPSTRALPKEEEKKQIAMMIAVTSGVRPEGAEFVLDKVDEILLKRKVYDNHLQRLAAETSQPGIDDNGNFIEQKIENSTPAFIEEKQMLLNEIGEQINEREESGDTSLIQQLKINNQLQLMNLQINLKILNTLNLMNESDYINLMMNRRELFEKEFQY